VDLILDAAGQKGTGKWTVIAALDAGIPLTLISEAVFARCISSIKDERVAASKVLAGSKSVFKRKQGIYDQGSAQGRCTHRRLCPMAQGYQLMRATAKENGWNLITAALP